ncbi:MAG: GspH/FimT family pseudopilin [Pseudomonadota bacterium]
MLQKVYIRLYTKSHISVPGFSLVELLIVMALLAVLMTIAAPQATQWMANSSLSSATRDLVSNLHLARMRAAAGNTTCAATFNIFLNGFLYDYAVYIDSDNDLEYDAGEELLCSVRLSDYNNAQFDSVTFPNNDDGLPTVGFNSRGLAIYNAGASVTQTVTLSNSLGTTKTIRVTAAGSVSVQ